MQAANIEFSLSNFGNLFDFKHLFEKMKQSFEKEQKEILFHKKSEKQEKEYFNVMKFFFTSPDRV